MRAAMRTVVICTVLLGVGACGSDRDDLKAYVEQVKQIPPSAIEPLPPAASVPSFAYAATDLNDPFVPRVVEAIGGSGSREAIASGILPDPNRLPELLEAFELNQLSFTGTLSRDRLWALIRTPDGLIHRVQVGNYLGQHHGRIESVTESVIVLRELVMDAQGVYTERRTELPLSD